jgi:hypothetical protein
MNVRAGDIRQVIINAREFDAVGEGDITIRLAGYVNTNTPTGNRKLHTQQRRKNGGFEGLGLSIDDTRRDIEFLQAIADAGLPVPMNITMASGVTYSGDLVIEGELDSGKGDGTLELSAQGVKFEQI